MSRDHGSLVEEHLVDDDRPVHLSRYHERKRHSGLGITSFVLSIVAMLLLAATALLTMIAIQFTEYRDSLMANSNLTIGCFVVVSVLGSILGLLGMASVKRKRTLAVYGYVVNSLPWFIAGLVVIASLARR
jgi:hypothetical protein